VLDVKHRHQTHTKHKQLIYASNEQGWLSS